MKRMCEAKKLMSKAGSLEKSGGLGNTPWVKAKHITSSPMNQSNSDPGRRAPRRSSGSCEAGSRTRVRNS